MGPEDFQNQTMLRAKLAEIAGSSPVVKPFTIDRAPVEPIIRNAADVEELESIDPNVLATLKDTTMVKLTRATRPMAFDVALFTHNVIEDQGFENTAEFGIGENDDNDDDEGLSGGEDDE